VLLGQKVKASELRAIDTRIVEEIDAATDAADASPMPEPLEALRGVYAGQPAVPQLWFREDVNSAVEKHERASGWGTFDA
jgi:TPP-dependent pyruvate/acetoin dehydrogenase alpha subunit